MLDYFSMGIDCVRCWVAELMEDVEGYPRQEAMEMLKDADLNKLIELLGFYYEISLK